MPCIIDGVDAMQMMKDRVGRKAAISLTISDAMFRGLWIENRVPEEYDGMHYGGKCVWEYEIEGFWSTCMYDWGGMTCSGDHHLRCGLWRDLHSNSRVVHLREQASQREAQFAGEPFPYGAGWNQGTNRLVVAIVVFEQRLSSSHHFRAIVSNEWAALGDNRISEFKSQHASWNSHSVWLSHQLCLS